MIQKFFDSFNCYSVEQKIESLASPVLAVVLGIGGGLIATVSINKMINERVLSTCNQNLNQIIYIRTAIGDSYGCISRAVLQGPSAPIKP